MALALAGAGADVAVAARAVAELEQTAHMIRALGRRAIVVPTDVADYAQVEALIERTAAELGRLDVLVNNSGVASVSPVAEMAPEEFRRTVEVNLIGVFNGCRAAAGRLIAQESGKVINLASVLGAAGLPGYAAYSASKGGVIALTRALGVEWARHNIQVNAIAPGWIETDMTAAVRSSPMNAEIIARTPAKRWGQADEIIGATVFLASRGANFITGATLPVDGGYSVY
jgi:NAD(P)-dependent dehydrogenase (short-subunit alcohol dehydrogenase family)